jgi:hypothetical protein
MSQDNSLDTELLDKLIRVLDRNDLVGVISMCTRHGFNAPGEYEPEAKAILQRKDEWSTVSQLQTILKTVFDDYFSYPDIPDKAYLKTAREIWNLWLVHNGGESESFPGDVPSLPRPCPVTIYVD